MTDTQTNRRDIATDAKVASAFLEARNFGAVEHIAFARLADDPHDLVALTLLVKIAEKTPNHDLALVRVRQALASHPTDIGLRMLEVTTLLHLKRGREVAAVLGRFQTDFPGARSEYLSLKSIWAFVYGKVQDVHRAFDSVPWQVGSAQLAASIHTAGGYLEADPHFRAGMAEGTSDNGFLWTYAFNELMLCRFSAARRYARAAMAIRTRRFEKRVILCSYLCCIPTILWVHLVYVAWRMGTAYFPTPAVSLVFLLFLPLLYAPLTGFAAGWASLGLPFGSGIAVGSVIVHMLAMLSFEPRIAARLADPGKAVEIRGY